MMYAKLALNAAYLLGPICHSCVFVVRLSTRQLICVIEKGFVVERQRRITVNENVYNAALVFISPDMNLIANKSSSIASYEDVVATAEQSLENHNNL